MGRRDVRRLSLEFIRRTGGEPSVRPDGTMPLSMQNSCEVVTHWGRWIVYGLTREQLIEDHHALATVVGLVPKTLPPDWEDMICITPTRVRSLGLPTSAYTEDTE